MLHLKVDMSKDIRNRKITEKNVLKDIELDRRPLHLLVEMHDLASGKLTDDFSKLFG